MKITAQLLRDHSACNSQIELFIKHFPEGATVTLDRCREVAQIFNWDWAAEHLLTAPALAAYYKARAAAKAAYYEARAAAAKAAYYEARAAARATYYEACDAAWTAYCEACAAAFATLLIKENQ